MAPVGSLVIEDAPAAPYRLVRGIAERDGITEGIVGLVSAVEPCMSFQVRRRHKTKPSNSSHGSAGACTTTST